jgi:hypothetical protein
MAEKIKREIHLNVYNADEVPSEKQGLINEAKKAALKAYALHCN